MPDNWKLAVNVHGVRVSGTVMSMELAVSDDAGREISTQVSLNASLTADEKHTAIVTWAKQSMLQRFGLVCAPADLVSVHGMPDGVATSSLPAIDPWATSPRPPSAHQHTATDVTDLTEWLAAQPSVSGVQSVQVPFLHPLTTASAVATNLAAGAISAVSDPNLRQIADLRGLGHFRIHGRIGGTLVGATKIRLQYHLGGNIAVSSGDVGWTTLADSGGSHTVNVMFLSSELVVPAPAQIENCIIRPVLYDGNGVADPTISCCLVRFFP